MTREQFLKAYFDAIEEAVDKNCRHPEDILCAALSVTEALYNLVTRLPTGAFNLK